MKYVKMPTGCRHAFLSQTFSNDPQNAPGAHTLCHGGCDVCDLRVAAVRDLSCRFCRSILLHSTAGLVKPELLKRCMATPCNQVWPVATTKHFPVQTVYFPGTTSSNACRELVGLTCCEVF